MARSETTIGRALEARHRRAVEGERAQRHDRPERGKQRADQRWEHRRAHAMHVAKPVLLRKKHKAAADCDEDQPGPEILRRTDAHHPTMQLYKALFWICA
jgi:hypothetical protein